MPTETKQDFLCKLRVSGDDGQRTRALRKAVKLLLRVCGVRVVELRAVEGANDAN